eukprot:UN08309
MKRECRILILLIIIKSGAERNVNTFHLVQHQISSVNAVIELCVPSE